MPLEQVGRRDAISKAELHARLRAWLASGDERTIGPHGPDERTAWVHVQDGDRLFNFHIDTKREAVEDYMRLVDRFGDGIAWEVVPNRKGRENAVAFGPDKERTRATLYLYLVD